jgi:hypothetical protein
MMTGAGFLRALAGAAVSALAGVSTKVCSAMCGFLIARRRAPNTLGAVGRFDSAFKIPRYLSLRRAGVGGAAALLALPM